MNIRNAKQLVSVFTFHDFKTPAAIKSKGLVGVIRDKQLFKTGNMDEGVAINYLKGLSSHIDFKSALGVSFASSAILSELSAGINLKLLSDKYIFVPFIDAGIGASTSNGYYGAFTPFGTGVQVNISDEVFFLVNSQYRIPVTQNAVSHLYYSFTIAGNIGEEKKSAPPKEIELPVVYDKDGDGVVDSVDACPDIAGLAIITRLP